MCSLQRPGPSMMSADGGVASSSIVSKSTSTPSTKTILEFEVLYFQRKTTKVHKTKGISKFDGILKMNLTTGAIQLLDASSSSSSTADTEGSSSSSSDTDDDDEQQEKEERIRGGKKKKKQMKYQQRRKKQQQKTRNGGVPYNKINKALVKRCCIEQPLDVDDTIVLGNHEVQIVSRLSDSSSSSSSGSGSGSGTSSNNAANTTTKTALKSKPSSFSTATTTTTTMSMTRKRPLGPLLKNGGVSGTNKNKRQFMAKPLQSIKGRISNKTTTAPPRSMIMKKQPIVQSTTTQPSPTQPQQPTKRPSSSSLVLVQKGPLKSRSSSSLLKTRSLHHRPTTTTTTKPRRQVSSTTSSSTAATLSSSSSSSCNSSSAGLVCAGIPLPASIRTALRPHQVEGVEFLWQALAVGGPSNNKGAILADEMGLGKTLMTIAVVMGLYRKSRDKHFIVVCPSSLVSNWAKEFDKWVGKASQPKRVIIQKGDADSISRLKSVYSSTRTMGGQVLILSYELFRRVIENFTQRVGLMIMDEAHRMKNKENMTFAAIDSLACEARLCITATPVQNNLKEFYNLANFVRPGSLGDAAAFRRNFEKVISQGNQKNASREAKARGKEKSMELDQLIKPFMLRRLQEDVLKTILPTRTEVFLFCRPTPTQCQLYQKICSRATNTSMAMEALTTLTNLRKLCSHPALLDGVNVEETNVALSGKLVVLQSLLQKIRDEGGKVVVVSNFTSVLTLIEATILEPKKLPFVRLDGSTDQSARQGLVDSFNRRNSSIFAFLLSSKAGGCGLNLIGANRLIMVDADWNPATDTQAAARIYRPGQTKPCHIYRMFTTGTVEEIILQRQITKNNLQVFDGKTNTAKFTKEELADCFALKDCPCDTKGKLGGSWLEYDGPESLREQGSTDEVLLQVAENNPDMLSFVHIVEEKENERPETKMASNEKRSGSSREEENNGCSSSDEEMEF